MSLGRRGLIPLILLLSFVTAVVVVFGVFAGSAIASVQSVSEEELAGTSLFALPTQVLDRKGRLITQFFAEEKRELVAIDELPRHLIYALITREDKSFFSHHGFSIRGTARAAWNLLTQNYVSGGSTITQQLAGYLYADRSEFSLTRKLRELWWALQLEKHWTKNQILEKYLNTMLFGHGNYGVEAASHFYFGHSARELTLAESVLLVIQLANPSLYSPIRRPQDAQRMQQVILNRMVDEGYVASEEARQSFERYWGGYDFTRSNTSTAFFDRSDRAPYFSEYIRYLLENRYLLGSYDIYKDGFIVHTTLDLDYQQAAQREVSSGLIKANAVYLRNSQSGSDHSDNFAPMVDLLSLTFGIPELRVADSQRRRKASEHFRQAINPVMDMVSLMFGTDDQSSVRQVVHHVYERNNRQLKRTTVEGALITLENGSGHILSMIGGSGFEARNQFNRAIDARVEPGSSFKPLYYAAAIENRVITPATMIYDAPVVFWNDDGTPYTPENYKGEWQGPVLVRRALSHSMNVPSLRILEQVGFSDALETARRLLNISENEMIDRNLVRRYPVGLGIVEVAPVEMAQAFSTFANEGVLIDPIAIRYIESQDGKIILEPERENRLRLQRERSTRRVLSPQTAYVMTDLLQSTVSSGTLRYALSQAPDFDIPLAGKTGTTQNWSDAWTVGFSPYYTTALWMGFDQGGTNSLGTNQTGAVTAGPVWARYMQQIHEGLPHRSFVRPTEGIQSATVTARTGLLPLPGYQGSLINEIFLAGTAPTEFDTLERFEDSQEQLLVNRLRDNLFDSRLSAGPVDDGLATSVDIELTLDLGNISDSVDDTAPSESTSTATTTTGVSAPNASLPGDFIEPPDSNGDIGREIEATEPVEEAAEPLNSAEIGLSERLSLEQPIGIELPPPVEPTSPAPDEVEQSPSILD